jgi:hypothetical protein
MKRTIVVFLLLSFGVVAYAGSAQGAKTATRGRATIQFVSTERCALTFLFKGFAPGTNGRLEMKVDGATFTVAFQVPAPGGYWAYWLHSYLGHRFDLVQVDYRITAQGMSHVLSGSTMVDCDCGEEEGGGGGGGGGGNGGGGNSGGGDGTISDAGAAGAVTSQPGFAG